MNSFKSFFKNTSEQEKQQIRLAIIDGFFMLAKTSIIIAVPLLLK